MLWLLTAIFAFLLLHHFIAVPFPMWPDSGCTAHLAWRITEGDALYRDVWSAHPPGLILITAAIHLMFPNSPLTLKFMMLAIAVGLGGLTAHAAYRFGGATRPLAAVICASVAWLQYSRVLQLRPEAMLALLAIAAVHFSMISLTSKHRNQWAAAAALCAGAAMCMKPGAAAGALTAGVISATAAGQYLNWRRLLGFAATAASVPIAVLAYGVAIPGVWDSAWDGVVRYGRLYFRPLTWVTAKESLAKALTVNMGPWTISSYSVVVCTSGFWQGSLPINTSSSSRIPFVALFVLWPVLELGVTIPQTTAFPYIFANFHTILIYLLAIALPLLVRSDASVHVQPASAATLDVFQRGIRGVTGACMACGGVAAAFYWAGAQATVIALPLFLAFALIAVQNGAVLRGVPTVIPRALAAACVLFVLTAAPLTMPNLFPATISASAMRQFVKTPEDEFSGRLAVIRSRVGGKLLAFWICPSPAYLARWDLALRYNIAYPLFFDVRYDASERWREVVDAVQSPDTHVMIDWPQWYDMRRYAASALAEVPEYRQAMSAIESKYELVATIDAGYGAPLRVFADRQSKDAVASVLAAPVR